MSVSLRAGPPLHRLTPDVTDVEKINFWGLQILTLGRIVKLLGRILEMFSGFSRALHCCGYKTVMLCAFFASALGGYV